jgi:peptidyl-prolyl cis-trans isomerase B (cyclophilin B)
MHDYAPHLDGQYAAFGKVVDADHEIIDRIAKTRTTTKMFYYQDWPVDDIVIESVELA